MYVSKVEKIGAKKEKRNLIFSDTDVYTIPARENWNEGYSHSSKFLYVGNAGVSGNHVKPNSAWITTSK